jgi:hypothetical protein
MAEAVGQFASAAFHQDASGAALEGFDLLFEFQTITCREGLAEDRDFPAINAEANLDVHGIPSLGSTRLSLDSELDASRVSQFFCAPHHLANAPSQREHQHRSFLPTGSSDRSLALADVARRTIQAQMQRDDAQGLLIRASLKLRRALATATGWTLVVMMPLTFAALAFAEMQRSRSPVVQSKTVIAGMLALWMVHGIAIVAAALFRTAEAPQGRTFLTFRWLVLGPVFHAFLASRWLIGLAGIAAFRHSWVAFAITVGLIVTGTLVSIYVRAFLLRPLDAATLDESERQNLLDWCSEGKIQPPQGETMQPSTFFRTNGRWSRWRLAAVGLWLVATAAAPLTGLHMLEMVGLGFCIFLVPYFGYLAGFHILARLNPYDRPNGFLSIATGTVFCIAAVWTLIVLFPHAPTGPGSFGPMP